MTKTFAYSLTTEDWDNYFNLKGFSPHSLPFWIKGLYRNQSAWNQHLNKTQIEHLNTHFFYELPKIVHQFKSEDGTIKFQIKFHDGLEVETVLIPFFKRYTICISTQVGCAMGCTFCYTATQGLKRHLDAGEIVAQYLLARNWLMAKNPQELNPSIVFMGQGEPLHNFDQCKKAIEILNSTQMVDVGLRQMTLSTVGYVPGLKRLHELPGINIALSLHSPFDDERNELIPVNQRYPIEEVIKLLDQRNLLKRQFITFEYLLIKKLNMTDSHVKGLTEILGQRKALINLIPFNPFPTSKWDRPTDEETESFKQKLVANKLRVMVRNTKGDDILAACGQLRIQTMARIHAN
jgi:23S rRNA (adenine2503-C2)-methyltransferase